MRRHLSLPASLLLALLLLLMAAPALALRTPPSLVVVLVVDQLRAEQLTRLAPLLLPARGKDGAPGGFRYLVDTGAWHQQCFYDTLPTHTAVGHATLATGAAPGVHGIVGNRWLDPREGKLVASVEDAAFPQVGGPRGEERGFSPARLESTTVGDEMKLATAGRSRVFAVSLKDRAAILLGGRSADLALWFEPRDGSWVSSRWYRPEGDLPPWVAAINREGWATREFGWTWDRLRPSADYRGCRPDRHAGAAAPTGLGASFPHRVDGGLPQPGPDFYEALETSPLGTTLTFRMAGEVVRREGLGRGPAPDLLALNLASHDRIGHAYGPESPESADALFRADGDLAAFLALLDREVGLPRVLFVLTGDHGAGPLTEVARGLRLDAGRAASGQLVEAVQGALESRFGPGRKYVAAFQDPHLYLDLAALPSERLPEARRVARDAAREVPGVWEAFLRDDILEGRLPRTPVADAVARSFHRERSGDLEIVSRPQWYLGSNRQEGAHHGSPWTYDAHVPLVLCGPGIRPGERLARCTPRDLAPTLCTLLGIESPTGCSGRVLEEDL